MTEAEYLGQVARRSRSRARRAARGIGVDLERALDVRGRIERHPLGSTSLAAALGMVLGTTDASPARAAQSGLRAGRKAAGLFLMRRIFDAFGA